MYSKYQAIYKRKKHIKSAGGAIKKIKRYLRRLFRAARRLVFCACGRYDRRQGVDRGPTRRGRGYSLRWSLVAELELSEIPDSVLAIAWMGFFWYSRLGRRDLQLLVY